MLGPKTIAVTSFNESTSWSRESGPAHHGPGPMKVSHSAGHNYSEHGRPLLFPDEVLRLPGEYLIAFLRNTPPILCRRVKWWELRFDGQRPPGTWWWVLLAAMVAGALWSWRKRASRHHAGAGEEDEHRIGRADIHEVRYGGAGETQLA